MSATPAEHCSRLDVGTPVHNADMYAKKAREDLCGGHFTDEQVAFRVAMVSPRSLEDIGAPEMAKDRIRWLSTHLSATQSSHDDLVSALQRARVFVAENVKELIGSCCEWDGLTNSYDRSTIDDMDRPAVEDAEQALAQIDAALTKAGIQS